MAVDIGPKIGIDGESDFRKQINNIIQQARTLDAEYKSVTATFDENDNSQEKLAKQSQILSKQIEIQKDRVSKLESGLEACSEKYGENDNRTLKWKQSVYAATTQLKKMESQLSDVNEKISEVGPYKKLTEEIESQQEELDALKEKYKDAVIQFGQASSEANDLAGKIDRASSELKQNREALKKASDAADQLDNSMENAEDSIDGVGDASDRFVDIVKGNLTAEGIKGMIEGVKDLHDETMEYRKIMASLEQSSRLAGYSADETSQSYKTLIGVLADTQTAATTTANLQALGLEQENLNALIDGTIGAWAKFGDSIPIDGLAESITETARTGKVTGNLADVLNWTAGEEDLFNEELENTKDVTERANKIVQKFTEYGLTDMGKQWQENNSGMMKYNQSTDSLEAAMAKLGKQAEPVLTDLVEGLSELLELINLIAPAIREMVSGSTLGGKKIVKAIDPAIDAMEGLTDEQYKNLTAMMEQRKQAGNTAITIEELTDICEQLKYGIEETGDASGNAANTYAGASEKTAVSAANTTTSIGALKEEYYSSEEAAVAAANRQVEAFASMDAGVQEKAVSVANAIAGMSEAVASSVQSQMDIFSQFEQASTVETQTILNNMQSQVDGFNNWGQQLSELANTTKTTADGVEVAIDEGLLQYLAEMGPEGAGYVAAFNQMTAEELQQANSLWTQSVDIGNMTTGWGEDLKNGVGNLAAGGSVAFQELSTKLFGEAKTSAGYTGQGFIEGIKEISSAAAIATSEMGDGILKGLDDSLGVQSPSWKTEESGEDVDQGLINGINAKRATVNTTGKSMASGVISSIREVIENADTYAMGMNVGLGFARGIVAGKSHVIAATTEMAQAAIIAAKTKLEINSPSKAFGRLGEYSAEGYAVGFEAEMATTRKLVSRAMAFTDPTIVSGKNTYTSEYPQKMNSIDAREIYEAVRSGARDGQNQVVITEKSFIRALRGMGVAFT